MVMRGQTQRFPKIGVNFGLKNFAVSVKRGYFQSWRTLIYPPLLYRVRGPGPHHLYKISVFLPHTNIPTPDPIISTPHLDQDHVDPYNTYNITIISGGKCLPPPPHHWRTGSGSRCLAMAGGHKTLRKSALRLRTDWGTLGHHCRPLCRRRIVSIFDYLLEICHTFQH